MELAPGDLVLTGTPLLIDHLAVGPFEKLPDAMDHLDALCALSTLPNVAVKASATPSMSNMNYPYGDTSAPLRRVFDAFGPDRMFWGSDNTRMNIPIAQCVRHFSEHLDWLPGRDLARVMGGALSDWLSLDTRMERPLR